MKPFVIIGGGGHARVLVSLLRELEPSKIILGFTDVAAPMADAGIPELNYLGDDVFLTKTHDADSVSLVNGIGSVKDLTLRERLYILFKSRDYSFPPLIHPGAIIAQDVFLGEGCQIMAGAILQPGSRVGNNSIINTGAIIDHDCRIGAHSHIAPGCTISGGVTVGDCSHIGTGATLIQGLTIGQKSLVAAGSVVIRNVKENSIVMGIPAREKIL